MILHDPEHPLFEALYCLARRCDHRRQEMHSEPVRAEIKGLAGRHDLPAVEDEGGNDSLAGVQGQPECAVVEFFQGLIRLITGPFGVETHVEAHLQHFFHFSKAIPPAVLIFTVHQHAASPVHKAKYRDLRHFYFSDRLIAAGDKGCGDRDVHQGIVVANDNIGLAIPEMFPSFHPQRTAGQRQKNIHPYPRHPDEASGLLRILSEIAEEQERDQEQQHGDDEDNDDPNGPQAPDEITRARLLDTAAFGGFILLVFISHMFSSFQSMGEIPLPSSQALALEKCLQPKNPLSAEKGEG